MFKYYLAIALAVASHTTAMAQSRAEIRSEIEKLNTIINKWENRKAQQLETRRELSHKIDLLKRTADKYNSIIRKRNFHVRNYDRLMKEICFNKPSIKSKKFTCEFYSKNEAKKNEMLKSISISDKLAKPRDRLKTKIRNLSTQISKKRKGLQVEEAIIKNKLKYLKSKRADFKRKLFTRKRNNYSLSRRTTQKLKEFQELKSDFVQMQKLGNFLLALAPFRHILGGVDLSTPIEITDEEWEYLGKASAGLSSHYRHQLKLFCATEALSLSNSMAEKRFWTKMRSKL